MIGWCGSFLILHLGTILLRENSWHSVATIVALYMCRKCRVVNYAESACSIQELLPTVGMGSNHLHHVRARKIFGCWQYHFFFMIKKDTKEAFQLAICVFPAASCSS
jgi:hypothetical protein